jgi:hypothetical protein
MMRAMVWLGRIFLGILFLVGVVACQPADSAPLPTLAQMPSPLPATFTAIAQQATPVGTPLSPLQTRQPIGTPNDAVQGDSRRATLPATWTPPPPTATLDASITPSVTPSATITDTPSPTFTPPPTIDPQSRPLTSLLLEAANATVLPTDFIVPAYQGTEIAIPTLAPPNNAQGTLPTPINVATAQSNTLPTCQFFPSGGFATAFANNPDIANQLGCPLGNPPDALSFPAAVQAFQQGDMLWVSGDVYVLTRTTRTYQRYSDTFIEGTDPNTSTETPPEGLFVPVRGFLKVWTVNPTVRSSLGWGVNAEQGTNATVQDFANGKMIWLDGRTDIYVLIGGDSGTWRSIAGSF